MRPEVPWGTDRSQTDRSQGGVDKGLYVSYCHILFQLLLFSDSFFCHRGRLFCRVMSGVADLVLVIVLLPESKSSSCTCCLMVKAV